MLAVREQAQRFLQLLERLLGHPLLGLLPRIRHRSLRGFKIAFRLLTLFCGALRRVGIGIVRGVLHGRRRCIDVLRAVGSLQPL